MFNFSLSQRPNEKNSSIPIENPLLDQVDVLNDFDSLNEKIDSMDIITHHDNFMNNEYAGDSLDIIYEVESDKRPFSEISESKLSYISDKKNSLSNLGVNQENSLSQLSEEYKPFFFIKFFIFCLQFHSLFSKTELYNWRC